MTATAGYDVIVIGAGTNGLTAACVLAKRGKRVLVVERAEHVGGKRRLIEFAPGFKAAPFGIDTGWASPAVLRAVGIPAPPVIVPEVSTAVVADGATHAIPTDASRGAETIRAHSARDATRWPELTARLRKLAGFLEALYQSAPPDIDTTSLGDLPHLLSLGRRFRALGKRDMGELLRVLPMSIDDFLGDELESDVVKAAVGAGGVRDLRQGPRSGGTVFNMLHYLTGAPAGSARARAWWSSAPDAFVGALALRAATVGVTFRTGVEVARITVHDDAVTGVVLVGGEEIAARAVVSTADPAHTFLGMVDPVWLDPEFLHAARNIKYRGCTAYVLYAVDRWSWIDGAPDGGRALAGTVSLTPSLTDLERAYDAAKYGECSAAPHVELTVQTLRWPSLAPTGKHVVVARAQYMPYAVSTPALVEERVTDTIARACPGFAESIVKRQVLTPRDLEARYGFTDGAATHGELTLDQILFMRPIAGWGRSRTPIDGLYIGGSGAHPGPDVLGAAGLLAAKQIMRA